MKCFRGGCAGAPAWSPRVECFERGGGRVSSSSAQLAVCDLHKAWFVETADWLIGICERSMRASGRDIDPERSRITLVPLNPPAEAVRPLDDGVEAVGRFFGLAESQGLPASVRLFDVVRIGPPLIAIKLFGCLPRDLATEVARGLEAFGGGEIAEACRCGSPTCYRASLSAAFVRHCLEIVERLCLRPRSESVRLEVRAGEPVKLVRKIAPIPLPKVRR